MTAQGYYEEYWKSGGRAQISDPLTGRRLELLHAELGPERGSALDVGCGNGDAAAWLAAQGFAVTGFDLSPTVTALAAERVPGGTFHAHSAESLPWPVEPESQDLVVAFEVVEHLLAPSRLLEGAYAALKPGGLLAVSTPYHGRLKNVAIALARFEQHYAPEGEHIRYFTDGSLVGLLEGAGLAPSRVAHLGRLPLLWQNTLVIARRP